MMLGDNHVNNGSNVHHGTNDSHFHNPVMSPSPNIIQNMTDVDVEALEGDDPVIDPVNALSQKSPVENVFKRLDLNQYAENNRGHSAYSKHTNTMGKSVQKRHANIAAGRQLVQNGASFTMSMLENRENL